MSPFLGKESGGESMTVAQYVGEPRSESNAETTDYTDVMNDRCNLWIGLLDRDALASVTQHLAHPDQLAKKLVHSFLMRGAVFHIPSFVE